VVMS